MKNSCTTFVTTVKTSLAIAALSMIAGGFFIFNNSEEKVYKKEKGPHPDRPDLAIEQEMRITKDPVTGTVPRERLAAAWAMIKQQEAQKNTNPNPLTVANWTERGPSNIGGRTRAVMFDPNDGTNKKVWAGGVSGGLWYTNDITVASPTWVNVDDFWANMAVSCIAYDPSNTQVFYVGTGEGWYNADAVRGAGIWKTTNGGATWAQLSSTNNSIFYYVQKIIVESTGVLYAATRAGGVRRSTNGGTSWTQVLAGSAADLEISANGTLFATIGIFTTGGIYKSTDGTTWSASYTSGAGEQRIEIATAPSDLNTLYAMVQDNTYALKKIMQSTNAGTSWASVTLPTWCDQGSSSSDMTRGQAWYDLILAVDPNNASIVLAGGVDIMKSTDAGTTWSQITRWSSFGGCAGVNVHADQHAIVFQPGSSSVIVNGNDGGVYYSTNGGSTFANKNTGYNVTQFYACAMNASSGSNYFLAGAQDNGTQKFTTAGVNSTTQATGGDGAFCHIDQTNATYQLTAYVYNYVYRSTNGGTSFSVLNSDQSSGDFINPSDYDDANGIFYSSYSTSQLNRISGIRGTPSAPAQITITGMTDFAGNIRVSPYAPGGTTTLFIGTQNGKLFKATNMQATPTVTNISGASFPAGTISCVELGASESDILVTFSNYGVNSVWRTTDGGTIWSNKDNATLPDMPIRWAIYNPNNYTEVLLATEVGVWSTTDVTVASPTWVANNSGLSNVRVDMFQYRSSDKMLIAATHGRGLFSSDVFGASPPVAAFSGSPTTLCVGSNVAFTDASTNTPTSWSWTFQGGSPSTSTAQNPSVTYTAAGTYSVSLTATNSAGSDNETKLSYITVNANPSNSTLITNVSCNGGSNGSIDLSVSGGTFPYTYSWNPGGQTTQDISSLTSGTYTVLTTDNKGCTDQDPYTVTQPLVLAVSMSKTDVSCNGGSDGTASATPSGGTSSYTYSWNPGGQTTSARTSLSVGNYTCTVTDNNGCIATGTVAITQPSVLSASMSKTDATCTNADGSATATPSGGTSPYTYSWNPGGGTTQTISNVAASNYTCNVTDAKGCTVTGTVTVGSTPCGPTQLQPAYCGITLSSLDQKLGCVYVSGATAYEYRVTHPASGFTGFWYRWFNHTDFYMSYVSGVGYGKTYNVDVRSYDGGTWSAYGPVCTVTTPAAIPPTQLAPAYCGTTLSSLDQKLGCVYVSGATAYEYRVTHPASGFTGFWYRWFNHTDFYMSYINGVGYGKTYNVDVRSYDGGTWSVYGPVCTVTTPAATPSTQLAPAYCGITLSSLDQKLGCVYVSGATAYEYRVTHPASGFTGFWYRWFNHTDFYMPYISGVEYGKTYNVEVSAYVGGAWSAYGTVCTVTTPASIPLTQLNAGSCGATLPAVSTSIYCNAVTSAADYEYRVVNVPLGYNSTRIRGNSVTEFSLSYMGGILINTTYNVEVRAKVGGVWGSYGAVCAVTTGPVLRLAGDMEDINYSLHIYPNPVSEGNIYFNVDGAEQNEEALIEIYNLVGAKVYAEKINYSPGDEVQINLDDRFVKGIYFLNAIINKRRLYQKFVVVR